MGGGILQEPGVLIFPVVIVYASLLLGKWAALIFAGLSVLSEALVFSLAAFGLIPDVAMDGNGVSGFLITILLIAITAGLLWIVLDSLEHSVERAQSSEARWRSLVENAPVTIVNTDRNGFIQFANHFGNINIDDVIGKSISDFTQADDNRRATAISRQVIKSGKSGHFESFGRNPENQKTFYAVSVGPVVGPDGEVEGLTYIILDITEKKRGEDEIRRLNLELELLVQERTAQLEISNKELASLSYSVSHDLRTPLRAIDGFSLALLEDCAHALDDQGRDYLNRVRAASQRMGFLIDDLLRLASIVRRKFQNQTIDLSNLATSITNQLADDFPKPQIELIIQPDLKACGDENLLRIALKDLFGNAWKFTSERELARIEFGCLEIEDVPTYFVRDNGIGFDMQYVSKLFEPFQHLHGSNKLEGSGVGLAVVYRVIQKHGGKIWAESQVRQGATFYFTLSPC
jgi:PAS domain S-box-containing protein